MPTMTHGKSANVYANGNDLTGYLKTVSTPAEVDTAECSTFADDDKVYVVGLVDAKLSAEGFFDATFDGNINTITGSGTKSVWSDYPMGDAVGNSGAGIAGDVTSAERTAEIGDVVAISLEVQSSVGFERVISHHALAQRSAAGTATVVDNNTYTGSTAATTNGGWGYLHATQASGTVVVKIQDSADNSTFADLVTLGSITAVGGWRVPYSGTVRRYTRLTYTPTPSGTATFVAGFGRG